MRWGRGAKPRADGSTHRARLIRDTTSVTAPYWSRCVTVAHLGIERAIVRNWSNTGRGANYPLLRSRRPSTEEERSAKTQPGVVSIPSPFLAARFYWLTKSPVFARREALRELGERIPSGGAPELKWSASSDGGSSTKETSGASDTRAPGSPSAA